MERSKARGVPGENRTPQRYPTGSPSDFGAAGTWSMGTVQTVVSFAATLGYSSGTGGSQHIGLADGPGHPAGRVSSSAHGFGKGSQSFGSPKRSLGVGPICRLSRTSRAPQYVAAVYRCFAQGRGIALSVEGRRFRGHGNATGPA